MQNLKWVIVFGEALGGDKSLRESSNEGIELFLEGRSPWDAVLLLFLNVFAGHVSSIVQQHDVPLHDSITILAGV